MALPFILGLAVGAGAVIAFNKSDKLKEKACDVLAQSKDFASNSLEKGKEVASDVKNTIDATAQCISQKKHKETQVEEHNEKVEGA